MWKPIAAPFAGLAALLFLASCDSGGGPSAEPDATVAESEAEGETPMAEAASLRLYVFDCGRIDMTTVAGFGLTDEETDVRSLAVPCYVIDHPMGKLLWDGGLPLEVAALTEPMDAGNGMTLVYENPVVDQWAQMGWGLDAFDFVAFSHLHFDHVGVANALTGGTLLIQKPEFEAAFEAEEKHFTFQPEYYQGAADLDRVELEGDHDVFGDGSVMILSAPGHTPGHQVLLLRLANTGPVVLSGDLYHFAFSREHRRTPDFNTSREETLASMDRIERLLVEEGAELWIEHEMERFQSLKKAPGYFD